MFRQRFEYFIDLLCEGLNNNRIKLLIENGFDQWQQMQQIKIEDLSELKYSNSQIKHIINQINKTYQKFNINKTHPQTQQLQNLQIVQNQNQNKTIKKQIIQNQINIQWLIKGTSTKPTKPYQKFLQNVTMISLQQKKLTKISDLKFMTKLQIIHLGSNFISKMQGIQNLYTLKTLKLDHNMIKKIQNVQKLINLTKLDLNYNQITRLQNLVHNTSLIELTISYQKIQIPFTFQEYTLQELGNSLEILTLNANKIQAMNQLKHLKLLSNLEIKNNNIKQVSQIADVISAMTRIKKILFLGNPIVKAPKYRDYLVILSKSLQQLDDKKILPSQRQYLVKLYSLKHAKQKKQQQTKQVVQKVEMNAGMSIYKIHQKTEQGQKKIQKLNSPTDFYNNSAYVSSKHVPKK